MPAEMNRLYDWILWTACDQVDPLVLRLVRLGQARLARRLDADEHRDEVGVAEQPEQLLVADHVDAGLRVERQRPAAAWRSTSPGPAAVPWRRPGGRRSCRRRRTPASTPRSCQASTSCKTCSTGLKRILRPYMTMMSQNSQVNGQPRRALDDAVGVAAAWRRPAAAAASRAGGSSRARGSGRRACPRRTRAGTAARCTPPRPRRARRSAAGTPPAAGWPSARR